ncbi:endonuclease/exonuclease/phosphatase family protein [Streptomyces sp. NPDC007945]|uniref:endonuclease/exonuclease/phosphatase family protein n=1 Tax=Streptomyces sp. NPDC007945 TaxID=3364797 RepID=UPI0036F0A2AB
MPRFRDVRLWLPFSGLVFLGALLAGLLLPGVPGPAGDTGRDRDGAREVSVLHYNMCGAATGCPWNAGRSGRGTSVARIVTEARSSRPDVITLNEVCATQYTALRERLAAAGAPMDGTFQGGLTNVPACGPSGRFGTAVLSREPIRDGAPEFRPFTDTGGETYRNAGRAEPVHRGLLCARTRHGGGPLTVCTAHTYAAVPGQLDEIRAWTADESRFPPETPLIVAGDLNLPPDAPAVDRLRTRFLEADRTDAPTADGRKIDYVFADRRHFGSGTTLVRDFPESDHAMLLARLERTGPR